MTSLDETEGGGGVIRRFNLLVEQVRKDEMMYQRVRFPETLCPAACLSLWPLKYTDQSPWQQRGEAKTKPGGRERMTSDGAGRRNSLPVTNLQMEGWRTSSLHPSTRPSIHPPNLLFGLISGV